MSAEAKAALAAEAEQQRLKELADSRQAQREKHDRARAAEAAAMREKQTRPGPGRPRKSNIINAASVTITNLNVIGSGSIVHLSQPVGQGSSPLLSEPLPPSSASPSTSSSSTSSSSPSSFPTSSSSPVPSASSSSSSSPPSSGAFLRALAGPQRPLRQRGKYIDWISKTDVFEMIIGSVVAHNNIKEAVKSLRNNPSNPSILRKLSKSTVRGWFNTDCNLKLLDHVRMKWESGKSRLGGMGAPYSLADHSELEMFLLAIFKKRRENGLVINSSVAVPILRTVIQQRAPQLLERMALSRRWVRHWLRRRGGFTYKKATTSGQKLPADWESQVEAMIDRAAAVVITKKVAHPSLVINWDQSAVMLMPTSTYTYHDKKDKHVSVTGQDDKRQITAVVAATLEGELLPLQMVFQGQEANRSQHKAVPVLEPSLSNRITYAGWHLTQTPNHWSSQVSMRDYVDFIIVPFVKAKRAQHNCPLSPALLMFDCWSVHKSAEFLGWMKSTHPDFHIVFIPAGCTGKAQPADVVVQRPLKCEITNQYLQWTTEMLTAGLRFDSNEVPDCEIDRSMGTLKPKLVAWTFHAWNQLRERQAMIAKGWAKIGLDAIFKPERQSAALLRMATNGIKLDDVLDGTEEEPSSAADVLESYAEEEECEDDGAVEEDEEEPDINVSIAACLEDRAVVQGVRRSSRVASRSEVQRDARMAQLLQDSVYEDGFAED